MAVELSDYRKVMKTAAWMWMAYLVSMVTVDLVIYFNRPWSPILEYYLVNCLPALLFLGLSYTRGTPGNSEVFSVGMVFLISGSAILLPNMVNIRLPQAPLSNLEGMILRQLPVLLIGLVLVAWHYRLVTMLLYSVSINLFELSIVLVLNRLDGDRLSAFFFIIVMRTVCSIVIGIFINQLIISLRTERESLKAANQQLAHYASTLESLTVSRERNRMSRELHDTVVHTLSGLSVQLETAKAYWNIQPTTARGLLEQSLEATRSGLQETRRALKNLRAAPLEDLGLLRALKDLFESAAQRGRLQVELSLPEDELVLTPDVETCIYRIAQEAVENVIHHANARHLTARLEIHQIDLILCIQDDGSGFDPEANSPAGHYGLAGMRERAAMAGGKLRVTSLPNKGTTVELVMKGVVK